MLDIIVCDTIPNPHAITSWLWDKKMRTSQLWVWTESFSYLVFI